MNIPIDFSLRMIFICKSYTYDKLCFYIPFHAFVENSTGNVVVHFHPEHTYDLPKAYHIPSSKSVEDATLSLLLR